MALRDVLARFGIEIDGESKLEHFDANMGETIKKFKEFGEIFLASMIGERLHEFIENQIKIGDELQDMSERLGVSTEDLQRFTLAARLSGMSAEEAATSLRFFNRNIGAAAEGGDAAKVFQKLHVDIKALSDDSTPLVDKVGRIAEGFSELKSHAEKTRVAMELFGRGGAAMIPVLSEGREKVEELFEEMDALGGGMSKEFTEAANRAEHATVRLKFAMQALKSRIAMELIPGAQRMTERITKWVVWAIKLSKQTYILREAIIALKLGGFMFILSKIVKLLGMSEGGALGFVKSLIKLGPIVLLAGLLFLIFDSLYTLWQGGDSVIGKLIDELLGVGTAEAAVNALKDAWVSLGNWWAGDGHSSAQTFARVAIGGLLVACNLLITAGEEIALAFKFAWDAIGGNLTDADKDLKKMSAAIDDFKGNFDKIGDWAAGKNQAKSSTPQWLKEASGSVRQPVKIEINNEIHGVSDPKAAGDAAGKATRDAATSPKMRAAYSAVRTGPEVFSP